MLDAQPIAPGLENMLHPHAGGAKEARMTCPSLILAQQGRPATIAERIRNQLQMVLPTPRHAITTNTAEIKHGLLALLWSDVHHHPTGTRKRPPLAGATLDMVYVSIAQMNFLHPYGHTT